MKPEQQVAHIRKQLHLARVALAEIRDNYGKVCEEFELCTHESCRSSCAAWMLADGALRVITGLDELKHENDKALAEQERERTQRVRR